MAKQADISGFKKWISPDELETTKSDFREQTVTRVYTDEQITEMKDEFFTITQEIEEREKLIKYIKGKFNENISQKDLAETVKIMILESKKLTDAGLKLLQIQQNEIAQNIELGTYKSVEEVYVVTSISKKKTAFYDRSGDLIEVVNADSEDINLFAQE